jgi:hypothetical protein
MKKIVRLAAIFFFSSLLISQSLVDVAKKEQERREKLKGKNVKVITNADLKSAKRAPAVTTTQPPAAPAETAAEEEPAPTSGQAAEAAYDRGEGSSFAGGVVGDTIFVDNAEAALFAPDGNFAEIGVMGQMDVEFNARNGPGDDIAVYARLAGLEQAITAYEEEGIPISAWPGGMFSYGVLAMRDDGEWQALGRAVGENWPDTFDLGTLKETKRIRLIFKPDNNPSPPNQPFQLAPQMFTMGVDAVEGLH